MIDAIYEETQEQRQRSVELAKYMSWRVLPREMKISLRRYLNFVWDATLKSDAMEVQVMEKLSPTLRSKLCVHIFGSVLVKCPFLAWMHEDPEAMKKLCLCVKSEFLEANDLLFSFGEMNSTVYILVNGWVTVCIGAVFTVDGGTDELDLRQKGGVARRNDGFDDNVLK